MKRPLLLCNVLFFNGHLFLSSPAYQDSTLRYMSEKFILVGYADLNRRFELQIEIIYATNPFPYDISESVFPNLKAIVSNTTSIEHLPVREAEARGIKIISLSDDREFLEQITCTAEHTLGLIMAAHRRIPAAHADVCKGNWDRTKWRAPKMLSQMSLGIVGMGRVGAHLAEIGGALFTSVGWYDPYNDDWLPPDTVYCVCVASLNDLAFSSDVLCICAGLREGNMRLVSKEVLESLPKGAIVVNTARAGLLDEEALVDLLVSGHIRAAALDTVRSEPRVPDRLVAHALFNDNLILTPHIAGSTEDALTMTEKRVLEKVLEVLSE